VYELITLFWGHRKGIGMLLLKRVQFTVRQTESQTVLDAGQRAAGINHCKTLSATRLSAHSAITEIPVMSSFKTGKQVIKLARIIAGHGAKTFRVCLPGLIFHHRKDRFI
jgi:hypothetical protein